MKREVVGKTKHVDSVANSIQPFYLDDTNALSNPLKNKILSVDCYKNNSFEYSYVDQYVVSYKN